MPKRLIAILFFVFVPAAGAFALPDGTIQSPPYIVAGALLDEVVKTTVAGKPSKDPTLLGYNLVFHDNQYQYQIPVCVDASLVEVAGGPIDPTAFVTGDTVVVSVRANTSAGAKVCVSRVVRQTISRGSSGGECLQDYQVKHMVDGNPNPLLIKTEYTYLLTIYARPTLDCDGQALGANPITTRVAASKPFAVTLTRDTRTGPLQLNRWSFTTDPAGRASLTTTFALASSGYKFQITPETNAVAGDAIGWGATAVDPHPSPSPVAAPAASATRLTAVPVLVLLLFVLAGAGGAEYWHWVKQKRSHELPEKEYDRAPKL